MNIREELLTELKDNLEDLTNDLTEREL